MKTNKIIAGMTLTWVLLSLSSAGVFADQWENKMSDKSDKREMMMQKNSMYNASDRASFKRGEMQDGQKIWGNLNDNGLDGIDEDTKEEVLEIIENFKEENQSLMEEFKQDFEEIKQDYKSEYEELKEQLEDEEDESVREDIKEELEVLKDQFETALEGVQEELESEKSALYDTYRQNLVEILWEDSNFVEKLDSAEAKKEEMKERIEEQKAKMAEKREEMKQKMQEAKEKRKEFRESAKEKISKYKNAYSEKIEDKLARIAPEKLQKFNAQLDELYNKVDASETMSDENKQMMLSRITALQDLVSQVLEESEIDLNELLEMEL